VRIQIVFHVSFHVAERTLFLPSAGASLIIAAALHACLVKCGVQPPTPVMQVPRALAMDFTPACANKHCSVTCASDTNSHCSPATRPSNDHSGSDCGSGSNKRSASLQKGLASLQPGTRRLGVGEVVAARRAQATRVVVSVAALVVVVALQARTFVRVPAWRSETSLLRSGLRVYPTNSPALYVNG